MERLGYFCVDEDSRPGALVMNRSVTLRESAGLAGVKAAAGGGSGAKAAGGGGQGRCGGGGQKVSGAAARGRLADTTTTIQ